MMRVPDRVLLGVLSLIAAWVSLGYTPSELPFANAFVVWHLAAGIGILVANWAPPYVGVGAMALLFSSFVGRSLGIFTALLAGRAPFPNDILLLAALQWLTLAWVVRPAHLVDEPDHFHSFRRW